MFHPVSIAYNQSYLDRFKLLLEQGNFGFKAETLAEATEWLTALGICQRHALNFDNYSMNYIQDNYYYI